ncbi:Uncharacterised protein [Vibrio cholerae]|nr:Uncharacterised protein [Vibrio cholerae]
MYLLTCSPTAALALSRRRCKPRCSVVMKPTAAAAATTHSRERLKIFLVMNTRFRPTKVVVQSRFIFLF